MKKEIIFGIATTVFFAILTLFFIFQYNRNEATTMLDNNSSSIAGTTTQGSSIALTKEIIATHNSAKDCWIIIEGKTYNVTAYLNIHPGGSNNISRYCGTDATDAFLTKGGRGSHSVYAFKQLELLLLGALNAEVTSDKISQPQRAIQQVQTNERRRENGERKGGDIDDAY
jgi:cytochrome b involved in lipid metabolism